MSFPADRIHLIRPSKPDDLKIKDEFIIGYPLLHQKITDVVAISNFQMRIWNKNKICYGRVTNEKNNCNLKYNTSDEDCGICYGIIK